MIEPKPIIVYFDFASSDSIAISKKTLLYTSVNLFPKVDFSL